MHRDDCTRYILGAPRWPVEDHCDHVTPYPNGAWTALRPADPSAACRRPVVAYQYVCCRCGRVRFEDREDRE